MAYYTNVTRSGGGRVVGASQRADLGTPGQPRLIVHNVVWTGNNRNPFDFVQQPCTFRGTAMGRVVTEQLTISGIKPDNTVHLA